jgi:hypothetical protein
MRSLQLSKKTSNTSKHEISVNFALLDQDPDSESGSNSDPYTKHCQSLCETAWLIKTEEEEEKEGGIEARHTLRVGGLKFGTLSDFARSASKVTYRKKTICRVHLEFC